MSAELLSSAAGVLLSLVFSYVPGINTKYDALSTKNKRLVMGAGLVVVTLGAFGLACANWFNLPVTCDQAGVETLIQSFILALVANQGTFLITKG